MTLPLLITLCFLHKKTKKRQMYICSFHRNYLKPDVTFPRSNILMAKTEQLAHSSEGCMHFCFRIVLNWIGVQFDIIAIYII